VPVVLGRLGSDMRRIPSGITAGAYARRRCRASDRSVAERKRLPEISIALYPGAWTKQASKFCRQRAIENMLGCEAAFLKSVRVAERFNDQTISEVQVFNLIRHPRATRCYAWYGTEHRQPSVMLHLGQVVDAVTAVRATVITTRAAVHRDRCGAVAMSVWARPRRRARRRVGPGRGAGADRVGDDRWRSGRRRLRAPYVGRPSPDEVFRLHLRHHKPAGEAECCFVTMDDDR